MQLSIFVCIQLNVGVFEPLDNYLSDKILVLADILFSPEIDNV